jgi:hypothetical protein
MNISTQTAFHLPKAHPPNLRSQAVFVLFNRLAALYSQFGFAIAAPTNFTYQLTERITGGIINCIYGALLFFPCEQHSEKQKVL